MSACLFTDLFVANLHPDVTAEQLKELFQVHGVVVDCWIGHKKYAEGDGCATFGSLRMSSNSEAFSAKKGLNGFIYKERKLVVKWALNERLIWIGNLSEVVTEQAIYQEFSRFGYVERAVLVRQAPQRHAFVLFKDKKAAKKAMSKAEEGGMLLEGAKVEWARVESHGNASSNGIASRPAGRKSNLPPGFVCICTHKSVQLDRSNDHFTRDTHDQQLHDEMEVEKHKEQGANVQTMYLPGGGLMAVNPSKNLVIGARAHRMAVFMGQLTNYDELVEKYGIVQPLRTKSGRRRVFNVSELLCILYSKMGLAMLSELQGKYAFCMYDPRLVRVLAVRDPTGTYPVVQAYTTHNHLVIVCGPFFPAGHREEIMLEPSQYKYGWHAPPLYYEGKEPLPAVLEELDLSEDALVKKKRTRRGKKGKKGAAAEAAAEQEAVADEIPAEQVEEDLADMAADGSKDDGSNKAADDSCTARRRRRRRRSGRKSGGTAVEEAEASSLLLDGLDECGAVPAAGVAAMVADIAVEAGEHLSEAGEQEGAIAQEGNSVQEGKAGKRRRRRHRSKSTTSGSQRSSFDLQADNENDACRSIHQQQDTGSWRASMDQQRDTGGWRASMDQQRDTGNWRAATEPRDIGARWSGDRQRHGTGWWASNDKERDLSGSWRSSPDKQLGGSWRAAGDQRRDSGSWRSGAAADKAEIGNWRVSLDMYNVNNSSQRISVDDHSGSSKSSGSWLRESVIHKRWDSSSWQQSLCQEADVPKHKSVSDERGVDRHAARQAASHKLAVGAAASLPVATTLWDSTSMVSTHMTASGITSHTELGAPELNMDHVNTAVKKQRGNMLGLSSHRISVGQDLDSLGNMLAAGLVEAVAAMKPSRSCSELTALLNANGQGPKWVW